MIKLGLPHKKLLHSVIIVACLCRAGALLAQCYPYNIDKRPEITKEQQQRLQNLAAQSDAFALFLLSRRMPRYLTQKKGVIAECSINKEWIRTLEKSAKLGLPQAQYELGKHYYDTLVAEGNEGGDLYSFRYRPGDNQPEDPIAQAEYWLQKAAQSGYKRSYETLGRLYMKRNPPDALHWLKQAAKFENESAKQTLQEIKQGKIKLSYWYDGKATQNWLANQIRLNHQADVNPAEAMYQLSHYSNYTSLEMRYLQLQAASMGQQDILDELARFNRTVLCKYRNLEKNNQRPKENCLNYLESGLYFTSAYNTQSEELSAKAKVNLSLMQQALWQERDTKPDAHKNAFNIYQKLAKNNNLEGMYKLAITYDLGHGVEQNDNKTIYWYKTLMMHMELGDKRFCGKNCRLNQYNDLVALDRLNLLSLKQLLGKQYNKDIIEWLEYTADKKVIAGHLTPQCTNDASLACQININVNNHDLVIAYYQLAMLYLAGENGYPQDDKKAVYWLLKSQKQFSLSRLALLKLFAEGRTGDLSEVKHNLPFNAYQSPTMTGLLYYPVFFLQPYQ